MRLGVTGTQIGLSDRQLEDLYLFLLEQNVTEFHHGDCVGADAQVALIIREMFPDAVIKGHPPKNKSKQAFFDSDENFKEEEYLVRNKSIVDNVDLLLVLPKENKEVLRSGTWSTKRYADKSNVNYKIFER